MLATILVLFVGKISNIITFPDLTKETPKKVSYNSIALIVRLNDINADMASAYCLPRESDFWFRRNAKVKVMKYY